MSHSTLYVARGRTVQLGAASYSPGATLSLPPDEAARLVKLGFLQEDPPVLPVPETVPNPAAIGLQNPNIVQGPAYRR
jgi:hypothetical protein